MVLAIRQKSETKGGTFLPGGNRAELAKAFVGTEVAVICVNSMPQCQEQHKLVLLSEDKEVEDRPLLRRCIGILS